MAQHVSLPSAATLALVLLRRELEANGAETLQDLVLAADDRFWDAYELATQGRPFAAIYLARFAGEMLLKTAGFRFDGVLPGDAVQPRLGPAKAFGAARFPTIAFESYHSLRFWVAFLEHKRADAARPLDPSLLSELHKRVDHAHEIWWVSMRYRAASVPSGVAAAVQSDLHPLLEEIDWLRKSHAALWS